MGRVCVSHLCCELQPDLVLTSCHPKQMWDNLAKADFLFLQSSSWHPKSYSNAELRLPLNNAVPRIWESYWPHAKAIRAGNSGPLGVSKMLLNTLFAEQTPHRRS